METYLTLFKLILKGNLGHAGQLAAAKEEKAAHPGKKGSKPGGKGAKGFKGKHSVPAGFAQRLPHTIEQVRLTWPSLYPS